MKTLSRFSAAFALLLPALTALAGTQGRVSGRVTDSAGKPLDGVTVTITTPAIRNFKLTAKTSSDGRYGSIVNDATMMYHVRFEKEGFAPAETDKKFSTVDITNLDQKLLKTSEAPAVKGGAPVPAAQAAPSANDQAVIAHNEGVVLFNSGNKAAAEAKFKEAVAKNPDLPTTWEALAKLAHEKKDWAHVLEYGQKATDLDPALTSLYKPMAEAADKSGDKKRAAELQKQFEDANPDTPEILYNKGIGAYNKKKSKEAEEFLSKAVEAKPDFALAHYYLAMSAMNNKRNAVAREHFQKYLELEPNGSEAATAKELLPLVK